MSEPSWFRTGDQSAKVSLVSAEAPFCTHNQRHTRTHANRIADVDVPQRHDSVSPFGLAHYRRVLRSRRRHAAEGEDQECRRFHLGIGIGGKRQFCKDRAKREVRTAPPELFTRIYTVC